MEKYQHSAPANPGKYIRIYIFMPSPFGFVPELRQTTFKVVNLVWKKEHSRRQMETLKQRME